MKRVNTRSHQQLTAADLANALSIIDRRRKRRVRGGDALNPHDFSHISLISRRMFNFIRSAKSLASPTLSKMGSSFR